MQAVVTVVAKSLLGGVLVLVFAALSETLKPKRFAGILAAAPSVAIAGLAVGAASKGPAEQAHTAHAMIAGAVALAVHAGVAVVALPRLGAGKGTVVSGPTWLAVAGRGWRVVPGGELMSSDVEQDDDRIRVAPGAVRQLPKQQALIRFGAGAGASLLAALVSQFAGSPPRRGPPSGAAGDPDREPHPRRRRRWPAGGC